MKKIILLFCLMGVFIISCDQSSDEIIPQQEVAEIDMSDFYVYTNDENLAAKSSADTKNEKCYSMQVLNQKLKENPGLYKKMYDIEKHTRQFIAYKRGGEKGKPTDPVDPEPEPEPIDPPSSPGNTISVIFHVIYRTDSENISDTQLQQQIDALNEDFNLNNPERSIIPTEFQSAESNIGVNFVLDRVIRRKNNRKRSWRPDDSMKFNSSGGSNVISPEHYLNIWVVNNMPYNGGNILGYAQFPGGDWTTDGIVLDHRFTGNTSYSTGRTATHEIGHWMNLRHIWGDGGCGFDDFVSDTPESDRYNSGCPVYPVVHCNSNDMTMNFMDYANDPCMTMFTNGQKSRMEAVFSNGGDRASMNISF